MVSVQRRLFNNCLWRVDGDRSDSAEVGLLRWSLAGGMEGRVVGGRRRNATQCIWAWATHVDRDTERVCMVPVLRVSGTDASLAKGN